MTNQHLPILQLSNISIQRGNFTLCNGITLTLNAGDVCHLVGTNGSGKTTLLMQLAGVLPMPTLTETTSTNNQISEIRYLGADNLPIQPIYISHQLSIYPELTVAQNLTFLLNLYGITPTKTLLSEALDWVDLAGYESIKCHELSAGQARRVNLARLHIMTVKHTKLWLLDEPFSALDSNMVIKLQAKIQAFANNGGSVLMSSHQPVNIANKQLDLIQFLT